MLASTVGVLASTVGVLASVVGVLASVVGVLRASWMVGHMDCGPHGCWGHMDGGATWMVGHMDGGAHGWWGPTIHVPHHPGAIGRASRRERV